MSKESKIKKGTIIHGIAASEHLDSSGERIEIKGIDISSLTRDGVFNYEHKSEGSTQIVGKILEAKKIYSKSDCENEAQEYFWNKIKTPYLYVSGELFDKVGHSGAKDVAAMLKYDDQNKENRNDVKKLINFSIEGQKLDKKGSVIKKCIARKVSITITPCNKVCEAEELKPSNDTKKNDNFSMVQNLMQFEKNEKTSSCQIFKAEGYTPKRTFKPESAPDKIKAGDRIDYSNKPKTKHPKDIYGTTPKYSSTGRKVSGGAPPTPPPPKPESAEAQKEKNPMTDRPKMRHASTARPYSIIKSNMRKAIAASVGVGAPSVKVGGDALQKEHQEEQIQQVCDPVIDLKKKPKKTKKKMDKSINEEAQGKNVRPATFFPGTMGKSEIQALIKFVSEKHPQLSKKEQLALAKTVAVLRKAKKDKPFHGYNKNKHAKTGGLNEKAREKYNRENDANLKKPVTEKNPKGKKKARKKSFCARMSGVKGPTSKDGKLTPKGAALKRWNC